MSTGDAITVTTRVAVDPRAAFAVFTEDVETWWGRGPKFRFGVGREGRLRFEPHVGGRFLEVFAEGEVYEIGRILTWDPPHRLAFEFRPRAFRRGEVTIVDVGFTEETGGTRVTVEHRGWDTIPPDHPARHGLVGPAFRNTLTGWWGEQLRTWSRRTTPC